MNHSIVKIYHVFGRILVMFVYDLVGKTCILQDRTRECCFAVILQEAAMLQEGAAIGEHETTVRC